MDHRLTTLEKSQATQLEATVAVQLHMEDMEDLSSNNIRLKGLPEVTGTEDLPATITAIISQLLGDALPDNLEFDRIHRALGPRSADPEWPWDVICRFHRYTHRELVVRKAWDSGPVDFDGTSLKILPDLSRATLYCRAMLRPLLDLARRSGITYRWRYPLAITFRKLNSSFTLRLPGDLPACRPAGLVCFYGC